MSYRIYPMAEGLTRIEVQQPASAVPPFEVATNVYLLQGDGSVALVGSGHKDTVPALVAALAEVGVSPEQVDRVVVTAFWPDVYGGAAAFPAADVYVLAPSMEPAREIEEGSTAERERLLAWGAAVVDAYPEGAEHAHLERGDSSEITTFVKAYMVSPPKDVRWVPVRAGQQLNLAGTTVEVLDAPGPVAGSMALFSEQRGWIFAGETTQAEYEVAWVRDGAVLHDTITTLFERPGGHKLYPNRGHVGPSANLMLRRSALFLTNFISNVFYAASGPCDAAQLAADDMGAPVAPSVLVVVMAAGMSPLLERLASDGLLDAKGEGLLKHYVFGQ